MQRLSAVALTLSLAACGNATSPAEDYLSDLGPRDAGYDGALSFDGVDDYASVGTARAPHVKRDQTLMLWFRPEAPREDGPVQVLFTLHRSQESGFAVALDDGVPVVYKVYGGRDLARAADAAAPSRWHHLAFVIQAEQSLLYLDGAAVGESTAELTNRTPTQAFLGSADGFERPFHGALDDVRVYERAFSPEELQAVADGATPGDAEPLVLHLPFDEASGARAYDRSGLGNHAELGDGIPELMPTRIRR